MNLFKKVLFLTLAAMLAFFCGCSIRAEGARTIEEISGTYRLADYHESKQEEKKDILDTFEFFYLVVDEEGYATVIYKSAGSDTHVFIKQKYFCKYESGSTEMVTELKLKFEMPNSSLEGGVIINYLTVKDENLVCQKIGYIPSETQGMPATMHIVFSSFKKVSDDSTLSFAEAQTGIKFES